MGVELEVFRSRIGLFAGGKRQVSSECCRGLHFTGAMLAFAVITVLLHIGGIELNPGPDSHSHSIDEVSSKIDLLIHVTSEIRSELRSVKDDLGNMKSTCERLNEVCNDLRKSQQSLEKKSEKMEDSINSLQMQSKTDGDKIDSLEWENAKLKDNVKNLEEEIENLEARSRRDNLRFFGVREQGHDTLDECAETVVGMLNTFFPFKAWTAGDIHCAYRVGNKQDARRPRHLIAKFTRWSDVSNILKNREGREKLRETGVRIGTDLTRRQAKQREAALKDGKFAYFKSGQLVIEDRREDGAEGNRGRGRDTVWRNGTRGGGAAGARAVRPWTRSAAADLRATSRSGGSNASSDPARSDS